MLRAESVLVCSSSLGGVVARCDPWASQERQEEPQVGETSSGHDENPDISTAGTGLAEVRLDDVPGP